MTAADLDAFPVQHVPDDGKIVIAVDHRFALNMPALVSAPSKKSFSSVTSPILARGAFKSHRRGASLALLLAENASRPFEKLAFPLRDLIGMNIEPPSQFGQRLLALRAASATFALKAGRGDHARRCQAVNPLNDLSRFARPTLSGEWLSNSKRRFFIAY